MSLVSQVLNAVMLRHRKDPVPTTGKTISFTRHVSLPPKPYIPSDLNSPESRAAVDELTGPK